MTDSCWCGCGRETRRGAFFVQGHDKIAEAALLALDHGDSVRTTTPRSRLRARPVGLQRSSRARRLDQVRPLRLSRQA